MPRKRLAKPEARKATPIAARRTHFLRDAGVASQSIGDALAAAVSKFGSRPEVTAVDVGYKWTDGKMTKELCLRIHVREKHGKRTLGARERIPKLFHGIPTDVIEAIYYRNHTTLPRIDRAATLQAGLGISAAGGGAGTLGLLVKDAVNGAPSLLTAAHVLVDDPAARPGDAVTQPARTDGGAPADAVATITRVDFDTDSGLARLNGLRPIDTAIAESAVTPTALRFPAMGLVLEKSGRSTGVTRGVIDGLALETAGLKFVIHIAALAGDADAIADRGDSGAVWYEPTSGDVVGLHVQGSATPLAGPSYAIATSLPHVFVRLRVRL